MVNKIKQLICRHKYETITNLYSQITKMNNGKTTVRSVQKCKYCGKRRYLPYYDKKCKIIDYEIYYDKGTFRGVKNANNRPFN